MMHDVNLKFEVGNNEKHEVIFRHFRPDLGDFIGSVVWIIIDGKERPVERPIQIPNGLDFYFPGRYSINFQVGYAEIHFIKIEIDIFFGKYHIKVFVDDKLVEQKMYTPPPAILSFWYFIVLCATMYLVVLISSGFVYVFSTTHDAKSTISLLVQALLFIIFALSSYFLSHFLPSKEQSKDHQKKQ